MSGTILVVGAAGGVGSAVVRQLLDKGYKVIGTVLNVAEAEAVRSASPGVDPILELDLADANAVRQSLEEFLAGFEGELNGVVVTAAISPYGPVETTPLDLARRTLEINTLSHIAIYQAAMPSLRQTKGRIVFVSSMSGRVGMPFIGFYTASKFALEGATEVMRCEAAKWGVDISLIEPGGIQTAMVTNQIEGLDRDIANLADSERSLYETLYRQFQALARAAYPTALKPEKVAEVVVRALETRRPRVRYQVGRDSKALCTLSWLLPRRWLEALLIKVYASVSKPK